MSIAGYTCNFNRKGKIIWNLRPLARQGLTITRSGVQLIRIKSSAITGCTGKEGLLHKR